MSEYTSDSYHGPHPHTLPDSHTSTSDKALVEGAVSVSKGDVLSPVVVRQDLRPLNGTTQENPTYLQCGIWILLLCEPGAFENGGHASAYDIMRE